MTTATAAAAATPDPIRPDCDLCHEPLKGGDWTQWRFSFAEADRVAHTSCFEEFVEGANQKPTNVVTSNDQE